jgi:hypothetical protein
MDGLDLDGYHQLSGVYYSLAHLPRGMFVGPFQDHRKKALSDLSQYFNEKKWERVAWKQ